MYRLTPQIIRLQHSSRAPITVYIDSPGGITAHASVILNLLQSPDQDQSRRVHVITVATSLAASAAATVLCSGDYAIAYPEAVIHFHGVRTIPEDPITVERASDVAKNLKATNSESAVTLARNCAKRFFFRFVSLRSQFAAYRLANPTIVSEKDCFIGIISGHLSRLGLQVIKKALIRDARYGKLSSTIFSSPGVTKYFKKVRNGGSPEHSRLEAEMLKTIIKFELDSNVKSQGWNFTSQGLSRMNEDFFLLNDYIGHHQNDWIEQFCEQWKEFILNDKDKKAIEALPESDRKAERLSKLTPILLPLWLFLGALCHVLQEEENPLTPHDAFWLGLVDEVVGSDLPALRKIIEVGIQANAKRPAKKKIMQ